MGTERYTGISSRAVIGMMYEAFEAEAAAKNWLAMVGMKFNSDQSSEIYKWLGNAPAMREWIGGRQAKGLLENGFTITNKTFESTLEVLVDDLRRDKTGQLRVRIAQLAKRATTHWKSLISTLILNGETGVCYDSKYFFAADHVEGDSGAQSNLLSVDISALPCQVHGAITFPSPEEASQCIFQAISKIQGYKDDQGEPINEDASQFLVMCPPSLYAPVHAACTKTQFASGSDNILLGDGFQLTCAQNSRLATQTASLHVFCADSPAKAIILQEEEAPSVSAIAEGSEEEFKNNRHLYGVKAIRNAGYGYWQMACKVTMT